MLVAPSWLALLLAALGLANGLQANQGQQQSNRGRSSSSQKPTANLTEPSSTTQSTLVAPTAATPSAEPPARAPAEAPRRQSGGAPLDDEYLVGVGIADITGPSADINLMGYAKPNQDAGGIHLRQFSRSVIIEDRYGQRVLYTSIDNGMVSQLLRAQLLMRLAKEFGGSQMFNESNVMLSATHSHSCPGGFFQYLLYNIPSAGFIQQTLDALVDGIARSVRRASEAMKPARIYYHEGELLEASINRSPTAYANNPAHERARYKHDTDKQMQLLRLVDRAGEPMAMINWFPVHGTSMNSSNRLISSDNKGYASLLFEQDFNGPDSLPGKGKFVALFAQANEGDVSPNTRGSRCIDSGLPCDPATSTCGQPPRTTTGSAAVRAGDRKRRPKRRAVQDLESAWSPRRLINALWRSDRKHADIITSSEAGYEFINGRSSQQPNQPAPLQPNRQPNQPNEKCIASGPGKDMFESTQIIAYKQYYKARELFLDHEHQIQLRGPIKFIHEHIDMTKQVMPAYRSAIELASRPTNDEKANRLNQRSHFAKSSLNTTLRTCDAALGYSFAAGTTDGPGAFDFQQGDTVSTRYWNMMRDFLRRPSNEQVQCHHPKPILLSTGEMDFPYMWHPRVVSTQMIMIGQLAIVGLPGEFTTMSGRRVREAVQRTLFEAATRGTSTPSSVFSCEESVDQNSSGKDLVASERDDELSACRHSRENEMSSSLVRRKRAYALAPEIRVVLSGLSNVYTSYVTTIEEYEVQRYEGASTLYGPHTLQAYIRQFKRLARILMGHAESSLSKLEPPDLTKSLFTLKAGVIYDGTEHNRKFGDILEDIDTNRTYRCLDKVTVSFVAGNPRNDLLQEYSFLYVERYEPSSFDQATDLIAAGNSSRWVTVATDASWDTKFIWERTNTIFGESKATIVWDIPYNCRSGVYRIRHVGAHKNLLQTVSPYSGKSKLFRVLGLSQPGASQPYQQSPTELDQVYEEALAFAAFDEASSRNSGKGVQSGTDPKSSSASLYSNAVGLISSLFGLRRARN